MPKAPSLTPAVISAKGYTLIEIVAVIAIISIMLFYSMPRFTSFSDADDINGVCRWLMANVHSLKDRSLGEQKNYILEVSIDANSFSITNESIDSSTDESDLTTDEMPALEINENESKQGPGKTEKKTFSLPSGITLVDVEFHEQGIISSGFAEICFYRQGYSDKAIIHIEDENQKISSFIIEPFLPEVKFSEEYISFF